MDNHELFLYIMAILQHDMSIFWSWGPSDVKEIENGVKFSVNGFIYQGEVKVIYNEGADTFSVIIGEKQIDDIYLDNLVNIIDLNVENTGDDYYDRITEFIEKEAL